MANHRTLDQIAQEYHVSINTVRKWVARKDTVSAPRLRFMKAGARVLITGDAMNEFLERCAAAPKRGSKRTAA